MARPKAKCTGGKTPEDISFDDDKIRADLICHYLDRFDDEVEANGFATEMIEVARPFQNTWQLVDQVPCRADMLKEVQDIQALIVKLSDRLERLSPGIWPGGMEGPPPDDPREPWPSIRFDKEVKEGLKALSKIEERLSFTERHIRTRGRQPSDHAVVSAHEEELIVQCLPVLHKYNISISASGQSVEGVIAYTSPAVEIITDVLESVGFPLKIPTVRDKLGSILKRKDLKGLLEFFKLSI